MPTLNSIAHRMAAHGGARGMRLAASGALLAALSLLACHTPAPQSRHEPLLWTLSGAATSPPPAPSARTAAADRPAPAPPLRPAPLPSPFSRVVGADGQPSTTAFQLSPVLGATLFLTEGYPTWRIGKLAGDVIAWNVLPTRGLPEHCAWHSLVGRYPDLLWMRVPNDRGGLDYYRWQPSRSGWTLDKALQQGRRTAVDIVGWNANRLLLVSREAESVLGEPARTTWLTLPDRAAPKMPQLPRQGPSLVVGTRAADLVLAYDHPVEVALLVAGSSTFRRFTLATDADAFVISLLARSAAEAYFAVKDKDRDRLLEFHGQDWAEAALPGPQSIVSLVADSDGTLWLLDTERSVWKRAPASRTWELVPLPAGVPRAASLTVTDEPSRLWIGLESDAGEGMGPLLTIGAVKETNRPSP